MEQQQSPNSGDGAGWAHFKENALNRIRAASDKLNIKSLFLIHFSMSAWIMVGSYDGFGYLFHSVILLILLLYSIHFTSNCEAVAFSTFVEVCSMFLELTFLVFHGRFSFSLLLVVMHMLFRILAICVLLKEFNVRGGSDLYNALFGMPLRFSYDDLERPHLSVPPPLGQGEYMKSRAQQGLPR
ncbi:uncharacterized protein LOC111252948 isoform X1 [Varroa destructor]|uniref:Uncharacterized protein n=1 Tax=Varroa destructor TaxID=109461 RepID=A0A7M7KL07_VARDE|nr:uncharacterized protein LOC111252948 isoform X1 [Varroa destructor]XP_022667370.1 uncharacterized protein LOC111252948 isoform X1 [Varroa destructor]